jgi:ferredoxin-NADP reductase
MAIPKNARLCSVEKVGHSSQKLVAEFSGEDFSNFVPGKFLIVDTGLSNSEGKAVKRAYSLCDVDAAKNQFTCVVKKLEKTPGADYMHALKPGDELTFSGPWGKFFDSSEGESRVWLIATDTGLTACSGYQNSISRETLSRFFWFRESDSYFWEDEKLHDAVEAHQVPQVGQAERLESCWKILAPALEEGLPDKICMAGDGEVLLGLKEKFSQRGVEAENIHIELFFNNPAKKSV